MSRQLKPMPKLKKETAIYLAGLIDGEGCFYIAKQVKSKNYCYSPQFKIVLVDEKTIAWMADELQRHYTHQTGDASKNHKDTYTIRISDRQGLIKFIEQIIPYMILKKPAALTMLEFCESRVNNWPKNNYERKYSMFEIKLYDRLKLLNRVGVDRKVVML